MEVAVHRRKDLVCVHAGDTGYGKVPHRGLSRMHPRRVEDVKNVWKTRRLSITPARAATCCSSRAATCAHDNNELGMVRTPGMEPVLAVKICVPLLLVSGVAHPATPGPSLHRQLVGNYERPVGAQFARKVDRHPATPVGRRRVAKIAHRAGTHCLSQNDEVGAFGVVCERSRPKGVVGVTFRRHRDDYVLLEHPDKRHGQHCCCEIYSHRCRVVAQCLKIYAQDNVSQCRPAVPEAALSEVDTLVVGRR
mmetsp:Transcript_34087/g.85901  ORF Transcript_34087/g.85901 Transcript_34087/m.85901 type:complete len:250 (+) Transcript_34087:815-1564(+)